MSTPALKWAAILCFIVAMVVLLGGGILAKKSLPPYPGVVAGPDGKTLFRKADILGGQDTYQRYGLMDHGSVWGHGSQRGMEFSAVSLHRLVLSIRDHLARKEFGKSYADLAPSQKEAVDGKVVEEIKTNRYDPSTGTLRLTEAQVKGLQDLLAFWDRTFDKGDERYGFLPGTIPTSEERRQIGRFFFWTAWIASVKRPGKDFSYTNNWPPDKAAGNTPSNQVFIWTLGGLLSLFIVLGIFIYLVHRHQLWYGPTKGVSLAQKLMDLPLTSSQLKAAKFFLVVILLFLLQTSFGGLMAHYTVHPGKFYIPFFAKLIPYSWAKSWHLQLAIFWIATTWVGSAIYLAPIIGGKEPKKQGLLVQLLFGAILVVALGSLLGEVLGIKGMLGKVWFWFGHQGWEYLELGRIWQILLFVGLVAWLFIVYRAAAHHLRMKHKDEFSALIWFYLFSAILVVGFFAFGLFYGRGTNMTMADYWRWFVVHIWVESIFEFFGVAVISVLLVAMGLASAKGALRVAYFTAALTFLSGIMGTAHHYYWYGGPSYWLAIGSVFSSMEPIPLMGLVVRGLMEYQSIKKEGKEFPYKWPMYFLVASSFWNFLGAGVFGFLINLPIVNYYEHGTYLTVNHGHAALFGTYGMLSIALLLFAWRGLVKKEHWNDGILKLSFFGMNVGLLLMVLGTLFPVGCMQAWTSFKEGIWKARDASFFERGPVHFIGQIRMIPDLIIILFGVVPLAYFLFRTFPHLKAKGIEEGESVWEKLGQDL